MEDMELDQFKVVAVASGISLSNTPDSFNSGKYLYNHEEMQKVIQNPHYKIDDSYETNVSPTHDVNRITEILSCRHQQEIHKGGEVVYDFTGRWMEICSDSNLSQHHLGENKSSPLQGFCSVALRPDGHVAGIFDFKNSSSLMEVKQHIQKVKISLHML